MSIDANILPQRNDRLEFFASFIGLLVTSSDYEPLLNTVRTIARFESAQELLYLLG